MISVYLSQTMAELMRRQIMTTTIMTAGHDTGFMKKELTLHPNPQRHDLLKATEVVNILQRGRNGKINPFPKNSLSSG